ncbi:hypothetical protein BJ165DRAFT_635393 [Panaeolus papilionaceus]|nr:hypothetical protein BJ165DRAFT_635393 [Panaeolus papilionaceus]
MRFIASQGHRPDRRLDFVLGYQRRDAENVLVRTSDFSDNSTVPKTPNARMDLLYLRILDSLDDNVTVLKLLAFATLVNAPRIPLDRVARLLGISRQDVDYYLGELESLLALRIKPYLIFHHASLHEFLQDPLRSKHWYIDRKHQDTELALRALKLFRDETYIGAQWSFLRVFSRALNEASPSVELVREVAELSSFSKPSSTYHAAMSRFLGHFPVSVVVDQTFYMMEHFLCLSDNAPESGTRIWQSYVTQFTLHIKPYLDPYLSNPRLFSLFLSWVFYIPHQRQEMANKINDGTDLIQLSNHSWPVDLRRLCVEMSNYFNYRFFLELLSIPSQEFLDDALIIMLKNAVRPSSCVLYRWRGWRNLIELLRIHPRSEKMWICVMDYEERFSPYMRRRLHDDLWLSKEGPAIRHLRTSFQSRSTEQMKPFDAVLIECT